MGAYGKDIETKLRWNGCINDIAHSIHTEAATHHALLYHILYCVSNANYPRLSSLLGNAFVIGPRDFVVGSDFI